jgi:hypothetical protein
MKPAAHIMLGRIVAGAAYLAVAATVTGILGALWVMLQ